MGEEEKRNGKVDSFLKYRETTKEVKMKRCFLLLIILFIFLFFKNPVFPNELNKEKIVSIGISYGYNYGLKYCDQDLYFPNYNHNKFKSTPNYRLILYRKISKKFDIITSFSFFEYRTIAKYPSNSYEIYDFDARIINYSFDIGIKKCMFKNEIIELYFLGGVCLNKVYYDFIILSALEPEEMYFLIEPQINRYNIGLFYGCGVSIINTKYFNLAFDISTRDINIKKSKDNFGIYLDIILIFKI